jgi:hypothetical protein
MYGRAPLRARETIGRISGSATDIRPMVVSARRGDRLFRSRGGNISGVMERERRQLDAIERELMTSDPRLAARMAGRPAWYRGLRARAVFGGLALVGGTILTLVLLLVTVWAAWAGIALVAAGVVLLLEPARAARRSPTP